MNQADDISDKELSELYHGASRERSPASLDRAILDLAREHVQMHNTNTRLRKLTPRFAWAAVIVLSIGVVLSIQFSEDSRVNDITRHLSKPAQKPAKYEEQVPQNFAAKRKTAPGVSDNKSDALEKSEIAKFSAEIPAETSIPEAKSSDIAKAPRSQVSAQPSAPPSETFERSRLNRAPPPATIVAEKPRQIAPSESKATVAAAPRLMLRAPQGASEPEPAAPSSAQPVLPSTESTASGAGQLAQPSNDSAISPPRAKLKSKPKQQDKAQVAPFRCADLSQYACAVSPRCVLTKSDNALTCRDATNRCESAINQLAANAATVCEGLGGCRFISGDCECNKQSEQCVCKSKGPAICQPAK